MADEIFPELTGEALIAKLREEYWPEVTLSYSDARHEMFSDIDNQNGKVSLVYTGDLFETTSIPDHTIVNTEHTWPRSRFQDARGKNQMKTDLHHLFPTYNPVNSARANNAFGEIPDLDTQKWWGGPIEESGIPQVDIARYSESTHSVFEPREGHKGNVARAMFYFRTVYGGQNIDLPWFRSQRDTLLLWHDQDPVDDAERARSTKIAALQGSENPFVLDPSLVFRAFGNVNQGRAMTLEMSRRSLPPAALMNAVSEDASSFPIRIVSWNANEMFSTRMVNRRKRDLQEFADDLKPDILLIQEVTSPQVVQRIRDQMNLTGFYYVCTNFNPDDHSQHDSFEVAIISRYPMTTASENDPSPDNGPGDLREFPLRRTDVDGLDDVHTYRGFLRVRIEELKLIVSVVHLKSANGDSGYPDRNNAREREFVAAAVAAQVNRDQQQYPDYTILVGGDFNVGETDVGKNGQKLGQDCYSANCGNKDRYDETHALLSLGLVDGLRMVSKTQGLGMETYNSRDYAGSGPIDCLYAIGVNQDKISLARRAMSTFGSDHFAVWSLYNHPME